MAFQQSLDLRFWMIRGMARRMGVDFVGAMRDRILTPEDLAQMMGACRACGTSDSCLACLSHHCGPLEEPPEGCGNAELLHNLRH